MVYLIDTNVLLRFVDRKHPRHSISRRAIRDLRQREHLLQTTSQNCAEFWNVATRPVDRNGFGFTPYQAHRLLGLIERLFFILPDNPGLYAEWRRLIVEYNVSGVMVHDARLVAAMRVNRINHILTFNTKDFIRYAGENIIAVSPDTIL